MRNNHTWNAVIDLYKEGEAVLFNPAEEIDLSRSYIFLNLDSIPAEALQRRKEQVAKAALSSGEGDLTIPLWFIAAPDMREDVASQLSGDLWMSVLKMPTAEIEKSFGSRWAT